MKYFLQLHYVHPYVHHYERCLDILHPLMASIRLSSIHTHNHELYASAHNILHLHHQTETRQLLAEENLLLQ